MAKEKEGVCTGSVSVETDSVDKQFVEASKLELGIIADEPSRSPDHKLLGVTVLQNPPAARDLSWSSVVIRASDMDF
jgi:hypothetical protein